MWNSRAGLIAERLKGKWRAVNSGESCGRQLAYLVFGLNVNNICSMLRMVPRSHVGI